MKKLLLSLVVASLAAPAFAGGEVNVYSVRSDFPRYTAFGNFAVTQRKL
jgi:hypothetical protein